MNSHPMSEQSPAPFLLIERDGPVLTARLNRPETRNALTDPAHMDELVALCRQIRADHSIKALVLTGEGSAFCAGGNVKDMQQRGGIFAGSPYEVRDSYRDTIQRIPLALYELDVPVIVGGCATYQSSLHLMRTGAAGVLVGFGGGAVSATRQTIGVQAPMATAIADVAEARRDYMDESGGRYVQVIADGGMGDSGSFVKALALGADAVMLGAPLARATEAPGKGTHWGSEARHQTLPRGYRTTVGTVGPLEQVLFGPSHQADGKTNFIGALKRAMASTGYVDVKNFQRCGMVVNPYSAR